MLPTPSICLRLTAALGLCCTAAVAQISLGPITTLDSDWGFPQRLAFDPVRVDADGDGDPDIVFASQHAFSPSAYELITLLNDGTGAFSVAGFEPTLPAGSITRAVADFTGDGLVDVIANVADSPAMELHVASAPGSYAPATPLGLSGGRARPIQLDGPSFGTDLVWLGASGLHSARSTGPGTFTELTPVPSVSGVLADPLLGDLDGDGLTDVIVGSTDGFVATYTQAAGGGFVMQSTFATALQISEMAGGDFDGDGNRDLVTYQSIASTLEVRLGNGDGTFGAPTTLTVPPPAGVAFHSTEGLSAADLDNDGVLDLILTQRYLDTFFLSLHHDVVVLRGQCDGRFLDAESVLALGFESGEVSRTPGDMNGDGLVDLPMIADGLTSLALNTGAPTYTDLGNALAGSAGTPGFDAAGALLAGEPFCWTLTDALPGTTAALVLGASALNAPFKGGVLVPTPTIVLAGLPVGVDGSLRVESEWVAASGGFDLYLQWWVTDAGGPVGFAASPGVRAQVP